MKTMTDFINTSSVDSSPAVYNEDYFWAEEYAEYYNESSDVYVGDILNTSDYQFFGEAAFYQEAHKGLIAGGILALVSGAFFMIMKLLKNGGSGGGSTSSSKSSSGASTKSSSKSEPAKAVARTVQHANDVQNVVSEKADESKKSLNATFDALEAQGADVSAARKLLNENDKSKPAETPKPPKSAETPKPPKPEKAEEKKVTTEILPELEAEEKIVFNVKTIIDALEKFKKENGNAGTPYNTYQLKLIKEGLDEVDNIVLLMVGITRDDSWYVVSSSNIKDKAVLRFLENKHKLDEIISKLRSDSKDLGDKIIDAKPDDIIERLTEIDNLIRSIEKNCKAGMKVCKEKRQLEKYKKDIVNIDQVYHILNSVLKGVNVVCKNIQNEFKTIRKSLHGKKYHTLHMYVNGIFGFGFEPDQDYIIEKYKRYFSKLSEITNSRMSYGVVANVMIKRDNIRNLLDPSTISEREVAKWNNESKPNMKQRIKKSRAAERDMFKTLKTYFPDYERYFESLEELATRQLALVEALVDTPIEDTYNRSIEQIPAAMELKKFNDNFESYVDDMEDKLWDNGAVIN